MLLFLSIAAIRVSKANLTRRFVHWDFKSETSLLVKAGFQTVFWSLQTEFKLWWNQESNSCVISMTDRKELVRAAMLSDSEMPRRQIAGGAEGRRDSNDSILFEWQDGMDQERVRRGNRAHTCSVARVCPWVWVRAAHLCSLIPPSGHSHALITCPTATFPQFPLSCINYHQIFLHSLIDRILYVTLSGCVITAKLSAAFWKLLAVKTCWMEKFKSQRQSFKVRLIT